MPVLNIEDLAIAMIDLLAPRYGRQSSEINIIVIGVKPGEKQYEELMSFEETRRAIELEKYFSIIPAFRGVYHDIDYKYESALNTEVNNPYISEKEKAMSVDQIKRFLIEHKLLEQSE